MRKYSISTILLSVVLGGAVLVSALRTAVSQTPEIQAPTDTQTETQKATVLEAPKIAKETFGAMMGAIEDNNRAAFIAFADARFKAALTPPQFKSLVDQIAPRLQTGHAFKYLGEMNQAGFVVYLWRVRFEDGGDDFLAQMSVKDEKVGGFFLR